MTKMCNQIVYSHEECAIMNNKHLIITAIPTVGRLFALVGVLDYIQWKKRELSTIIPCSPFHDIGS